MIDIGVGQDQAAEFEGSAHTIQQTIVGQRLENLRAKPANGAFLHRDQHPAVVRFHAQPDLPVVLGVARGIDHEVLHDPFDLRRIHADDDSHQLGGMLDARTIDVPTLKQHPLARVQVGGHNAQRHGGVLDPFVARDLRHITRQTIALDQPARGQRQVPVGQGRLFHGFRQALQLRPIAARGIKRRHHAARRGAHHQMRFDARLFEHLDHAHVGKTTRSTAPQGQAKLWCTLGYRRIRLAAIHRR